MTAALNQDFVTYQGDDPTFVITVRDSVLPTGNPVDISTVAEITWRAKRNFDTAAAVTKTKTGGGITLLGGGTAGQFQVALTKVDTAALEGFYIHDATITDAVGNVTTVTVGRMQVGELPMWTHDAGQVPSEEIYQVRALIGDTIASDQQLPDAIISWTLTTYSNVWLAGAECCRMIAAQFARKVDTVQGEIRTLYSQQTKNYTSVARDLEQRGLMRGAAMPYAGGISVTDKITQTEDTDRVAPQFNIAWADNLLPVGPAGQQAPSPAAPESSSDQFPV